MCDAVVSASSIAFGAWLTELGTCSFAEREAIYRRHADSASTQPSGDWNLPIVVGALALGGALAALALSCYWAGEYDQ